MASSTRRVGILRISSRTIVEELLRSYIPKDLYGENGLFEGVHYDFESDSFGFKFVHPSIPPHEDGELIPTIEVELYDDGPRWKAVRRLTYEEGYQDGRHDAEQRKKK